MRSSFDGSHRLGSVAGKAGSADVVFALIDADIVDFKIFRIDHGGVNLADPAGILKRARRMNIFPGGVSRCILPCDVVAVPAMSILPFHGLTEVVRSIKVIMVQ